MNSASALPITGAACCNLRMLTGADLGRALLLAMQRKGVKQQRMAEEFGVRQPSVSEWLRYGRIGKRHLTHLVAYFKDVVGPEHWGLTADWGGRGETAPGADPVAHAGRRAADDAGEQGTIEGADRDSGVFFDDAGIEMITPQEVELIGIFRQLGAAVRKVALEELRLARDGEEHEAEVLQQRMRRGPSAGGGPPQGLSAFGELDEAPRKKAAR